MKQIIILIVLFTAAAFAQTPNWTSVKETNINVNNATSVDIFTNGYGNHIIVQGINSLKYYKMDVNGTAETPVTLEGTSVVSPSISGDATRLYVVYRKSNENYIRTKYSSDGGSSWSYLATNPQNSNASSMESVFSNNRLHVTYQVSNVIYYSKYEGQNWSTPSTVSTGENGTMPRITAWYNGTNDKVYFLYKKSYSNEGRWREYNVANNSWSAIRQAFVVSNSMPSGFRVDNTRIYIYYTYALQGMNYFNWVVRNISDNSFLNSGTMDNNQTGFIYSTYTADSGSHTVFYYTWLLDQKNNNEIGIWHSNSNDGYPSDLVYEYTDLQYFPNYLNLSSASNDVYVIWQDAIGGNNLRMKYDDQTPLTPKNFAVSVYHTQYDSYPKLTWDLNNEPDVRENDQSGYIIERRIRESEFNQIATVSGTTSVYIDYTVHYAGSGPNTAEYRIRANDVNNHQSAPSQIETIHWGDAWKKGSERETANIKYNLEQNYPNPFNPSTEIKYSLAKDSYVTLKVYDMLGKEVAELVNENKPAGNYTVEFNASNLPSGVYIYKLTAGKFTAVKKLILLR